MLIAAYKRQLWKLKKTRKAGEQFYTFEPENSTEEVWPFDQPFYFLLNLAIGGNFGGKEVDDSIFPVEYVIDYIRVYQ